MPLYEYRCESCGERFELIQKFSDPPPEACPRCGKGPAQRLLSSPAIQFKGTGWYITDYSQKGKQPASEPGSSSEAKPAEGSKADSNAKSDGAASGGTSTPAAKPAGGGSGTAAPEARSAGTASKS